LKFLQQAGVQVWLNRRVKSFDGYTVMLDNGEKLITRTLIWAAGVTGAPIKGLDEKCITGGNRLRVDEYNRVAGYENIFAIGDIAEMATAGLPDGYPMLAQPAIQQGRLLGANLPKLVAGKPLKKFVYTDKGSLATIGRNKAVADVKIFNKEIKTQGLFAWFIWLFVHLFSIIGFKNRLLVFINWIWNYLSYDAVMRVIIGNKKENEPVEKATDKVLV
jgi:NADH dehydrogenase